MTLKEFWVNVKEYIRNVLIGLDSFVNTIFGGAPTDTISGRAGRAAKVGRWWGIALSAVLNWIQKGHTNAAILHDAEGRHDEAVDLE